MSENKSEWGTQLIAAAPKRADPSLDPFKQMMSYYRCAAMEVETKFRVLDVQMSLNRENNPIESIKTRLKSPESIFEKLKRRDLPMTLSAIEENLNDIAGVRVVCCYIDDVYAVADMLLRQSDIRLVKEQDYIKHPNYNGYRSLHLDIEIPIYLAERTEKVRAEVQIRTVAMDFWASLEHDLRYKSDKNIPKDIQDAMLASAEEIANIDVRMQEIYKRIQQL